MESLVKKGAQFKNFPYDLYANDIINAIDFFMISWMFSSSFSADPKNILYYFPK